MSLTGWAYTSQSLHIHIYYYIINYIIYIYKMVLNNLPEDTLKNVTSYLLPSDVFNLCMSYPTDEKRYKPLLIGSLGNSLRRVMGSGSVKFRSSDPLQSFCDMTEFSPRGSIVLR